MDDNPAAAMRCLKCGYSLLGLPEPRCPECAREFDPRNELTFAGPHTARWIHLAKPPSGWGIAALLIILVVVLVEGSIGWRPSRLLSRFCPAAAAALLLAYLIRLLFVLAYRRRRRANTPLRPRGRWRWFALPVAVGIVGSAYFTNWPTRLRFALSRHQLELAARETWKTRHSPLKPGRMGLYAVEAIEPPGLFSNHNVCFILDYNPRMTLVYAPSGSCPGHEYQLDKNWFITRLPTRAVKWMD